MARLASPGVGQRHLVGGVGPVEQPGDDAVLALVDRHGRRLAAHRAVDRLDGHLARERGGVRLPRGDLALAATGAWRWWCAAPGRWPGRSSPASRPSSVPMPAAADGPRWATWSILCLCRQIALDEVDLDLVAGGDAAHEVARRSRAGEVLGDRDDRRDVVAGVRVLRGEEGVVVVELAHGDPVRPRGPLGLTCGARRRAPKTVAPSPPIDTGCASAWLAGGHDGLAGERGGRDGRVVDHPVDDHVDDRRRRPRPGRSRPRRAARRAGLRGRGSRRCGGCAGGGSSRPHAIECSRRMPRSARSGRGIAVRVAMCRTAPRAAGIGRRVGSRAPARGRRNRATPGRAPARRSRAMRVRGRLRRAWPGLHFGDRSLSITCARMPSRRSCCSMNQDTSRNSCSSASSRLCGVRPPAPTPA